MPNDDSDKKKATPGWYVDHRWPGEQRRWDGTRWLDDWRPAPSGTSPGTWMFIGMIAGAVGAAVAAVFFAVSETAGWIALGAAGFVAGLVFNIGAMGKAVEIGVRASRN